MRKRLKATDVTDEEWQNSLRRGDLWMGQRPVGSGMAPALDEGMNKTQEMAAKEKTMKSGDGGQGKNNGNTSTSFDRNCAPSQAPVCENANYDQLSYGQSHELCKGRGYHKQAAKAAPRARLDAMDAAENRAKEGNSNDMDLSTSVWLKGLATWRSPYPLRRQRKGIMRNARNGRPSKLH